MVSPIFVIAPGYLFQKSVAEVQPYMIHSNINRGTDSLDRKEDMYCRSTRIGDSVLLLRMLMPGGSPSEHCTERLKENSIRIAIRTGSMARTSIIH